MAEQLCELLGMKVDGFLRLTEVHVLPYLVLTRKRDIICRIGASRNEGESPFDVCSEKNNLAAILAFLLAQQSDNPEAMIMSLLAEIDPAFKGRSLAELVRIEPILIACDLLKSLGDAGEQNKERVSIHDFLCPIVNLRDNDTIAHTWLMLNISSFKPSVGLPLSSLENSCTQALPRKQIS
jgi:hypothetical protein